MIAALERKKSEKEYTIPRLVLLSSATIDPWISRKSPWVNTIVRRSAWHVYHDLELAEAFLRQHEDCAPCVYIKPGGLSVDVQRGHRLTLDEEESFVSYADIAAGMVEVADSGKGEWNNKNVGVVNANGKARFPGWYAQVHCASANRCRTCVRRRWCLCLMRVRWVISSMLRSRYTRIEMCREGFNWYYQPNSPSVDCNKAPSCCHSHTFKISHCMRMALMVL